MVFFNLPSLKLLIDHNPLLGSCRFGGNFPLKTFKQFPKK